MDDKKLRLIKPANEYMDSYLSACLGYKKQGIKHFFPDPDTYDEWGDGLIERLEKDRLGIDLKDGYVSASSFWMVREHEFIGEGSIRHSLTPALERFGGHIGYAIRADRWGMGYGTVLLALLLTEVSKLGMTKALITCNENNIASSRVIEKNNGIYVDTVDNTFEGEHFKTKRYVLFLDPSTNVRAPIFDIFFRA